MLTTKVSSSEIEHHEFIELLKQLAQAARTMRRNVEDIDCLLKKAKARRAKGAA